MGENLLHDHERDGHAWKGEWAILPEACLCTGKALAILRVLLQGLEIHAERMRDNLLATNGVIYTERVMLALASKLGKQSAHALTYQLAMAALERGDTLREALLGDPQVVGQLGLDGIEGLFDLRQSTGGCAQMVDRVIAQVEAQ